MKVNRFETEDQWLDARRGKVTGTRLKDLIVKRGTGKKIGYYQLIAERLAIPSDGEDAMERGKRLEQEAIDRFEKETGKKVENGYVLWTREDNDSIAVSPDGFIGEKEAVEIKCLGSAYHIKALLEGQVPKEFREQALQYFVVNDKLETLYFIFYDPRIIAKDFIVFVLTREGVKEEVEQYLELEKQTLEEISRVVNELSF